MPTYPGIGARAAAAAAARLADAALIAAISAEILAAFGLILIGAPPTIGWFSIDNDPSGFRYETCVPVALGIID